MLLEVKGLEAGYGGIRAVKGIDLDVREGELVCLIGANGAGKSTTLRAICGLLPARGGRRRDDGCPGGAHDHDQCNGGSGCDDYTRFHVGQVRRSQYRSRL